MTSSPAQNLPSFDFEGKILRKKNISAEYLKLAIQRNGQEKSITVYIPRNADNEPSFVCIPSAFSFLYVDAIIRVEGYINEKSYHHVTTCRLIKCAPNTKMIKEILALPSCISFASIMGYADEDELKRMVAETKSQKALVNGIIEKLTGRRAKAPPRYRPGRVRRSDMNILEGKEAEGRVTANGNSSGRAPDPMGWKLCQPCRPMNDTETPLDRRRESVINLPSGASDSISAHGKLTRSEYLETKKNHQATWFVKRIGRFARRPTRFLDVGGGRGDLAVAIATSFPEMRGVVVDSNERSVAAGREYAARRGVGDRVEFLCTHFADYVERYDAGLDAGRVDLVVALHACGDLSDAALAFAASRGCDFVVCPCCYPKRYLAPFVPSWHGFCTPAEVDALSRLAELDDHGEVSRRAMVVVNSMRRMAFEGRGGRREQKVELEEFDCRISRRNVALVGTSAS